MDPAFLERLEERKMKKRKLNTILPSGGSGPIGGGSPVSTLPPPPPIAPSSVGDALKEVLPVAAEPCTVREDVTRPLVCGDTTGPPEVGIVSAVPTGMEVSSTPALEKFRASLGHLHESLKSAEWGSSLDQGGEGAEEQMTKLLRSFAQLGNCLSQVIKASSETPSLSLRIAKERIDDLQYYLEQEKAATAQLTKDLEASEEASQEAHEAACRQGLVLRKAEDEVDRLRAQRLDAQRSCRRAFAEIKRLKATLAASPGSPSRREKFWRRRAPVGCDPDSAAPALPSVVAEKRVEELEKELAKERAELRRLRTRMVGEEYTLATTQRSEARFILKGVSVIDSACKSAFSAGFERCKKMVQSSSGAGILGQLQVDFSDECLKAVIYDNTETFRALSFISASTAQAPSCSVKEREEGAKATEE